MEHPLEDGLLLRELQESCSYAPSCIFPGLLDLSRSFRARSQLVTVNTVRAMMLALSSPSNVSNK